MTDRAATVDAKPISWPKAAIGAALFAGAMIVLLVVIPNLLIGSDPSGPARVLTIVYVAIAFALLVWPIAAWQNHEPSTPDSDLEKISAFGRPMRRGPGFESFAERSPSDHRNRANTKVAPAESGESVSSFGRPMRKKVGR